jgi:CspA family cold shock protein
MTTGTVKFFNEQKGYGFIAPDGGGNDAFVHISAVEQSGLHTLRQEQRVSFDLQEDRRGKMAAVNLKSVEESTQVQGSTQVQESTTAEANTPEPANDLDATAE